MACSRRSGVTPRLRQPLCRAGIFAIAACLAAWHAPAPQAALPDSVTVRNFFGEDFTFDHPLSVLPFPGEDSAYLVVQQFGAMIRVERAGGAWVASLFDSVAVARWDLLNNDDGGLLGFAFHPDYGQNRKYYVYHVMDYSIHPRPGALMLSERVADSTLRKGSGSPGRTVLRLAKPYLWHNGGTLGFDAYGYLFTAIGDGGSGSDPGNRSQNPGVLFGKMLRIDVDGPDAFPADTTRNYAIPADNPFTDSAGYLPEIWALGLRSPWKWAFHPQTGEIWLGDVGQGMREEITRVPKGGNLGWKMWEGTYCFSSPCPGEGTVVPVLELERPAGNSVTGGMFFTGDLAGGFDGAYIFGDYGTGTVWALREETGELVEYAPIANVGNAVSFNAGSRGELLAVSLKVDGAWTHTGTVQILEPSDMNPVAVPPARRSYRTRLRPPSHADLLRNSGRYVIRGLDGRLIRGKPSGPVWVREKGTDDPPVLVPVLP